MAQSARYTGYGDPYPNRDASEVAQHYFSCRTALWRRDDVHAVAELIH